MKDYSLFSIIVLALAVGTLSGIVFFGNPPEEKGFGAIIPTSVVATNITKTVTSTAVVLFPKNPAAQFRNCTNTGSGDLTLSPTTTNLTFGRGQVLKTSSSFTWVGDTLITGDIYVIGTSTVGCIEI